MSARLPVAERRAQLVQAALEVASAEGIAAATVRRVAAQAGVASGVVHYCFTTKEELLVALAARIVDDLRAAGAAEVDAVRAPDLLAALERGLDGLWDSIERTADVQLLTYEITTFALRQPGLGSAAQRQYESSQAAAEALLTLAAQTAGTSWNGRVEEVAAQALAFVDGVTLRWLVDRDSGVARGRLHAIAAYLSTQAEPRAAPRSVRA
ncbi:MAG: TetR family transcriptional regulator [Actinomycetota bacterium]|nr:TetR family transcriptional regulator [Actinomycetota bacterium]